MQVPAYRGRSNTSHHHASLSLLETAPPIDHRYHGPADKPVLLPFAESPTPFETIGAGKTNREGLGGISGWRLAVNGWLGSWGKEVYLDCGIEPSGGGGEKLRRRHRDRLNGRVGP